MIPPPLGQSIGLLLERTTNPDKNRIALKLSTLNYFINVVFDLGSDGSLLVLRGGQQLEM